MNSQDDLPFLNLSEQELEELRTNKKQLTEKGQQKIRDLMNYQKSIDEYFENNKTPTLKERFEEYLVTKIDWAQSHHVTANELISIVKEWLPKEDQTNTMHWNKCVKTIKNRLR